MKRIKKALAAIMLMTAVILTTGCKPEDTPNNGDNNGNDDSDVRVTTYTPQDITATTAKCGGDVIVTQGLSINKLGVCWSKEQNPTIENAHVFTTNWREPYVCIITDLEPETKYYVRAYALRGLEYYYGEEVVFTTIGVDLPTVITTEATNITSNSAKGGGVVSSEGSCPVIERGICWSTSQMPTIYNGSHVRCGSGAGAFSGEMMDLLENTVYYVRAYATNSVGTSYGEEVPFRTEAIYTIEVLANPSEYGEVTGGGTYEQGQQCTVTAIVHENYSFVNWTENGEVVSSEKSYTFTVTGDRSLIANFDHAYVDHAYVDLGLPSGTLWATCNVGADTPEGYGDYFAWGETQPKTTYNWSTYRYCNGDYDQLTKYCNNTSYGYNGFTDNLTVLQPGDDAATANWGSDWCMPTRAQWEELYQNTSNTWTTQNGVNGRLFTASNGHTLFLPAAGYRWGDELYSAGSQGGYWSSSLYTGRAYWAWKFDFSFYRIRVSYDVLRRYGWSVRAVREN